MPTSKKEIAIEFLKMAASGRAAEAFQRHAAPGFRHHIAELWDIGQEVPADSPNKNGMF